MADVQERAQMDLQAILLLNKDQLVALATEKGLLIDESWPKPQLQAMVIGYFYEDKETGGRNNNSTEDELSIQTDDFRRQIPMLLPLLPKFEEERIGEFFIHFERLANDFGWEKRYWCSLIQSVFVGKARHIYLALPSDKCHDYDILKEKIIRGYAKAPEHYRQKFRSCKHKPGQTFTEYVQEQRAILQEWKKVSNVFSMKDYDELVLAENFKFLLTGSDRQYINENHPQENKATFWATVLDERKAFSKEGAQVGFPGTPIQENCFRQETSVVDGPRENHAPQYNGFERNPNRRKDKYTSNFNQNNRYPPFCTYCHRQGHTFERCFRRSSQE